MSANAEILADSIGPYSKRVTTFRVTMHRFVLAEFNTHRMFSRNFRSSRAVPVAKLLKEVREHPACPVTWQANKPGMQGGSELSEAESYICMKEWQRAANAAADSAEKLMEIGLHKSWANRLLEPYLMVHGIVTGTEWQNFFALRCHPDAQPEIRDLAEKMRALLESNEPKLLQLGEWHLPLVDPEDWVEGWKFLKTGRIIRSEPSSEEHLTIMRKISVARCARVSYYTFDGKRSTVEEDMKLYDKLLGSQPLHASPSEHQASPDTLFGPPERIAVGKGHWTQPQLHGNLKGWIQLRKTLSNECVLG